MSFPPVFIYQPSKWLCSRTPHSIDYRVFNNIARFLATLVYKKLLHAEPDAVLTWNFNCKPNAVCIVELQELAGSYNVTSEFRGINLQKKIKYVK